MGGWVGEENRSWSLIYESMRLQERAILFRVGQGLSPVGPLGSFERRFQTL